MSRRARGQTLVLFALTLILLTLMVLITLQVGMRAKEKTEAIMVADAAAYSQAVATARTFNMIAVMNRARAAHFVALLGTESLVSWSGLIRGSAPAVAAALSSCGAGAAATSLLAAATLANPAWEVADDDSGSQARDHQALGGAIRSATVDYYTNELLARQLDDQQLVARIARRASPELDAPTLGDAKTMEEVDPGCTVGAVCVGAQGRAFLSVVMGSRGWVFTTDRAAATTAGGTSSLAPIVNSSGGGSGFGDDPWYGTLQPGVPAERAQRFATMDGEGAWAEDHGGTVLIQVGGCTASAVVSSAFVMSSAREVLTDRHAYAMLDVGRPESVRHTLLSCPLTDPGCPTVVGGTMAYNNALLTNPPNNDFGQPKLYAILERNYRSAPADPWALFFSFQFARSRPGALFDNGSPRGSFRTPAGADLSKQIALSAALVYYHRPTLQTGGGGFVEPPTLWNPFWRATLAPVDRDASARLISANYPEAAAVYDLLVARGYRGVP